MAEKSERTTPRSEEGNAEHWSPSNISDDMEMETHGQTDDVQEQECPSNISNDMEMETYGQTHDVQIRMEPAAEAQGSSKEQENIGTRQQIGTEEIPEHESIASGERLLVQVGWDDEEATVCTVFIDRKQEKPLPNYGGYRDTRSGVRYLNAIAQTELDKRDLQKKRDVKITRENLKPEQKKAAQQTDRETWTQMDRPGVILENRGDYVLIPGPYFTSDDWDLVRLEAAIIIQKYVRRSIARRTAHRMRAYAKERKEFWEEQERIRKLEVEEHLKYEIQRRMNPRSGDDFEILYTELASWCAQELNKINTSGATGMERRKAVKELLLKEIKLLQTIDKLRCKAARENKKERIAAALTKMSIPSIWELTNGSIVYVKTLGTARAADLMNLYNALAKPIGTNDERMGVLGYVKWTVQVFHTTLTREILELIEREADLMMRGRPAKSLSGLRLRILNLFLQFIETPEFNPEAASQQYVPVDFDYGVNSCPTRKRGPG